jgi:hypothetical protein
LSAVKLAPLFGWSIPAAASRVVRFIVDRLYSRRIAMRSYRLNSPEAAARIVALVFIADGHVCRSELDAWNTLEGPRELGLGPDAMPGIVQSLCEDLLLGCYASGSMMASVDDTLMAEVDDPALQRKVLKLALAAAGADEHLADGEALVLSAARRHWGLLDQQLHTLVEAERQMA